MILIGIGGHRQREHRNVVGAHHHHIGFDPVGQTRLHLRHGALQGSDHVVGVVAVLRAHRDLRTAGRGRRGHVLDLGQGGQCPFEGVGDLGLDGFGGGAVIGRGDRGLRVLE